VDVTNIEVGPGDGDYVTMPDGSTVVINLGTLITVTGSPDNAYDLAYYEHLYDLDTSLILMDCLMIDLLNTGDSQWYNVLTWCDGSPDSNTNIAAYFPESDNQPIPITALYQSGGSPQTGILIDVDAAPGIATGDYQFLRIYAMPTAGGDGCDVDSFEVLSPKVPY
jgi:hypothetical protein